MKRNKKKVIQKLIKDIQEEIRSLEEIYSQINSLIKKAEKVEEEDRVFYNRAAGSIIHDFYTGIEKIFCDIANKINNGLPKGEDWHIRLLKSMADFKRERPQVISLDLMEELKEFLGFRHLFRNIYGTQLDWDKLKILLFKIKENLWPELNAQLARFIKKIR